MGRMLEAEEIFAEVAATLGPKPLAGKRVLRDRRPDLRADRHGARHHQPELGQDGLRGGAGGARGGRREVTLVAGPTRCRRRAGVERVDVTHRARDARRGAWRARREPTSSSASPRSPTTTSRNRKGHKIKKAGAAADARARGESRHPRRGGRARRSAPFCVGFAAESENLREYAQAKRRKKKIPLLAANLAQEAFGARRQRAHAVRRRAASTCSPARRRSCWRGSWSPTSPSMLPRRSAHRARSTASTSGSSIRACTTRRRSTRRRRGRARPARLHRRAARCCGRATAAARADRHRDPPRRPGSRGARAAALRPRPQARHRARQPRRPDRLRLPGPDHGLGLEPSARALHAPADGAHRAARGRAGAAGRAQRGRGVRGERARRRRLRQHRQGAETSRKARARGSAARMRRCRPRGSSRACPPRCSAPTRRRTASRARCAARETPPAPGTGSSVFFSGSQRCTESTCIASRSDT